MRLGDNPISASMITKDIITEFHKYCHDNGWTFDNNSSEFTFQFRLGWFLHKYFDNKYLVDFEMNIKKFDVLGLIKKEIDIVLSNRETNVKHAIEIKFIKDKNGYDISLFKLCEDLHFLEQLKRDSGFSDSFAIAFSIIPNSHTASKNGKYKALTKDRLEFYKMFREDKIVKGTIHGNKQEKIELRNEYKLDWFDFTEDIKVCLIKI